MNGTKPLARYSLSITSRPTRPLPSWNGCIVSKRWCRSRTSSNDFFFLALYSFRRALISHLTSSRHCYFVAAYFIRDTLIFTHGKPLLRLSAVPDLSITWSSLIRLSVNDKIDASEVIDSLNDVIHFYAFALYEKEWSSLQNSYFTGCGSQLFHFIKSQVFS